MAAIHVQVGGAAGTTSEIILPLASECSDAESSDADLSMESDSGSPASSLSSEELYTRFLWDFMERFMEPDVDCGYIDLDSFLWGCAWLHVFVASEERTELEGWFEYYGDEGRLPLRRFPRFLHSWGDERQSILLRRCVMECDWHT